MTDALFALRPWQHPEVTSWGRLPMSAVDRRAGAVPLDGRWRFQLLPSPEREPGPSWTWAELPGSWALHAAEDPPQYTNVRMPWPQFPPDAPAANPTGVYEREVDIPAEWAGRRIVLHVGAAESVLLVHVDGRPVGVSKDSHLAAEFDLSGLVRPGERATVRLTVVKWSDASHIEDQDQWWLGGVTRPVLLYATDPLHLADVTVRARRDGELRVDCRVRSAAGTATGALPAGWYVSGELDGSASAGLELAQDREFDRFNAEDERVSDFLGEARLGTVVPDVRTWNAETPELYDLTVRLHRADGTVADVSRHRVGFRDVEIRGRDLLVNGERVWIRGVNRHDFHPLTGRTVSYEDMRADLLTLKRFGFNAIRTSHYPADPALYDLTDELGFYVVDEADIESHDHAHEIADDPRYLNAFVDRVSRMVLRDKNHPSVIVWSLGNESDYGANHDAAAGWLRRHDPTRPVQYEGAAKLDWAATDDASDIACPMYAPIEDCVAHALSGEQTRPLIQCEYSHAMGNSNGTLADTWAAIEATPGLQGGFIWEFWDHGILQRVNDGRPAGRGGAGLYENGVAGPGLRWAYGGDFGETVHDGAFIADGVVLPDRTPKPVMFEHREIAAPVRLSVEGEDNWRVLRVHNRQHFRDLSWLAAEWEFAAADGGSWTLPAQLPDVPPGGSAVIDRPEPAGGAGEIWLTLRVTTAGDEPWAPRGTEVCCPQVQWYAAEEGEPVVGAEEDLGHVPPPQTDPEGLLLHPLLASPPVLSLWRAPTDNDVLGGMAERWRELGLDRVEREPLAVERKGSTVRVRSRWATGAGVVEHEQAFTALVDGRVLVEETAVLPEELTDVARVGTVFETVEGLDSLAWYGQGPWESYPDRAAGAPVGHHAAPVDGLFTPYLRPQESGGRHGVRHFTLSGDGHALAVRLDGPRQVSVTRYRAADLTAVAHHDELVPRPGCVVHIDAAHRGLGTASCGPDTAPSYLVPPGVHRWSWTLRAL
ncbi:MULTISPECIES: glycoside hydrolase family 2 TIM barrel-domain containing protein [Streptomyces]|uniref:glycoside hydrolase family 2 TIM barrel-domain containing protein n=1 Tax=Streptomyces TaxID=1883 RepID=UPI001F32A17B|nr:glycoside hydrolase family 2 TIM barrel-domain containing protein [Streptomyces sp. AMCC400023]UJV39425.1 beta-galactosidase [Streptomyces sp. AMCC400023]